MSSKSTVDRWWWLKMLAASAGLAGLLLAAFLLPPVILLHHHARQYRCERDGSGQSLRYVANWAVAHHCDRQAIRKLLGQPDHETAGALYYYDHPRPGWNDEEFKVVPESEVVDMPDYWWHFDSMILLEFVEGRANKTATVYRPRGTHDNTTIWRLE